MAWIPKPQPPDKCGPHAPRLVQPRLRPAAGSIGRGRRTALQEGPDSDSGEQQQPGSAASEERSSITDQWLLRCASRTQRRAAAARESHVRKAQLNYRPMAALLCPTREPSTLDPGDPCDHLQRHSGE